MGTGVQKALIHYCILHHPDPEDVVSLFGDAVPRCLHLLLPPLCALRVTVHRDAGEVVPDDFVNCGKETKVKVKYRSHCTSK